MIYFYPIWNLDLHLNYSQQGGIINQDKEDNNAKLTPLAIGKEWLHHVFAVSYNVMYTRRFAYNYNPITSSIFPSIFIVGILLPLLAGSI